MGNHHNGNLAGVISNLVDDSVVSYAHPPSIPAGKLPAAIGPRDLGKTLEYSEHSVLLIGRKLFENLLR